MKAERGLAPLPRPPSPFSDFILHPSSFILSAMPLVRDQAVCLRVMPYSETSQILSLFTREHGRVRLIAKGATRRTKAGKSKFDGGLDLLDSGDAVFSFAPERDLSILAEWRLRDGHLGLRRDLRAL